jgi:hypothetical protein
MVAYMYVKFVSEPSGGKAPLKSLQQKNLKEKSVSYCLQPKNNNLQQR